jgi:hypothetical protein
VQHVAFDEAKPHALDMANMPTEQAATLRALAERIERSGETLSAELFAKLTHELAEVASTTTRHPSRRWLELSGRGVGLWGSDSTRELDRMRDEWDLPAATSSRDS